MTSVVYLNNRARFCCSRIRQNAGLRPEARILANAATNTFAAESRTFI
jgi:hypothetical protein